MLAGSVSWMNRFIARMDGEVDEECTFSSRNVRGARGGATVDDICEESPPRTTYMCTWMNVLDWTGLWTGLGLNVLNHLMDGWINVWVGGWIDG